VEQKLTIIDTEFEGLKVVEPISFEDERGSFSRIFCHNEMSQIFSNTIQQVNHSVSNEEGTVRGLHYQHAPYCEEKMIKCIHGAIMDIVVDVRKD